MDASGDICTGACGAAGGVARACFGDAGVGGFLAGAAAAEAGAAATVAGGGEAPLAGRVPVPGSGVMMLTGGVEAAVGNSALVGRPTSTDGPSGPCAGTSDPCAASGVPGSGCPGAPAVDGEPCTGACGMFQADA